MMGRWWQCSNLMQARDEHPIGGLARYFVEHREVGWLFLVAVLVWGWVAYGRLAQQEDPKIPERRALLVTSFPGASALKVEELVTKQLEKKIGEMEDLDEMSSQSRAGVSIITIALRFGSQAQVEQEWDQLRAKVREVTLPEGCGQPWLNTDFGKTVTLLFAITSPLVSEAESLARARLVQDRLRELRSATGDTGRAAVAAFFPPYVPRRAREDVSRRFVDYFSSQRISADSRLIEGHSFLLAEFATASNREEIQKGVERFVTETFGTDHELWPDMALPAVVMGGEDPYPLLRAAALPRYTYRQLESAADDWEDELRRLPGVGRVTKIGVVPEMIYLDFLMSKLAGYGITSNQVLHAIATRNAVIPGGVMRTDGQAFPVQLSGEFASEQDLGGVVVGLNRERQPIYLRDLFYVTRANEAPVSFSVEVLKREAGQLRERRAVLLAVEMRQGEIIRDFNREIRAATEAFQSRLPDGMEVVTLSDQPGSVAERIDHFMKCFLEAVIIVVLVALCLMDWRSAFVVATAIPLTIALTAGGMQLLGVPLHQISIAALIISLGMLVDDPVVASDAINRELSHGQPRGVAAWLGPWKLRRAILYATVINILAFAPLALLPGDTGAFIIALPTVVTLALVASRLVSMTFIPLLGFSILKGQKSFDAGVEIRKFFLFGVIDRTLAAALPRYRALLQAALAHPLLAVTAGYGLLALSLGFLPHLGQQFFPPAERSQLLIDVALPETASITQTRQVCAGIVSALKQQDAVENAAVFIGGSAPRFYYNVTPKVSGDYLAQVLVNTSKTEDTPALLVALRAALDQRIAGARVTVKELEQGPPLEVPIQVRLAGENLDVLRGLADQAGQVLRTAGGYQVHDNLGRRSPTLQVDIDQDRANTIGVDNAAVGRIVQAAFTGLKVTQLREGDRLIPVVVRLRDEERNQAEKIRGLYAESALQSDSVPLESFAALRLKPEFATIEHFGQQRAVTVKAFAPYGELPSAVLARARAGLDRIPLPAGYALEYAGEQEKLGKDQKSMTGVMALSLALIALAMVLQFHSVMKSVVVMLTVPLGLVGALSGLFAAQTNLGFMAMLGIVSLAGVIVSHIIVLSDFIEEARAEGMELKEALVQAGLVRLRAVLVTVFATVGGLVPLFLTGGELWHPLTAVHIFGLMFATLLTLVLLPVLYYLFCARLRWIQ